MLLSFCVLLIEGNGSHLQKMVLTLIAGLWRRIAHYLASVIRNLDAIRLPNWMKYFSNV